MTFSFIDVKVPGGTSQNNEPQMLNESISYHKAMAKAHDEHSRAHESEVTNDGDEDHDYAGTDHAEAQKSHKIAADAFKKHGATSQQYKSAAATAHKHSKIAHSSSKDAGPFKMTAKPGIKFPKKISEQMINEAKPDFLDFDKDGDKKEPMKKALRDKKKKMDSPTKDEPEGENGDTASMNPKIGDKTKKEYSMSMKPSKKKLYMSKEEVDVDDILSLDEASFDNYIDDMTIEELKELEEGIIGGTVKMIGKGIGALAKGAMGAGKLAAKGASAAANRMSASGRADAAERKLAKVRNKAVDIQRRIRAKKAAKVIARGGYSKYDPAKFQQKRVNYQMAHTEYEGEVMKESPIRTALKSVVENRGEHYRSATPPETIDDKLKGGGAKKMKADLMKGAKMNDTVAKAPEDAKAAGSRGPSAKPRNSGDNIRKGDTKIIQGGTPMKDPSSPKQRLESIMNAYASMYEKTHMITIDNYTTQGEPNAHKKFNVTKKVHKGPDGKRIHGQYGGYKVSFHGSKENLAKYNDHNLGGDGEIRKKDGAKTEATVNELSMRKLGQYRKAALGDIAVKDGQAAIKINKATEPGSADHLLRKIDDRKGHAQIAKGKMMIKTAKGRGRFDDQEKSSITKKRTESFSGTGVGTLGNIMDAYQSMNQPPSLLEQATPEMYDIISKELDRVKDFDVDTIIEQRSKHINQEKKNLNEGGGHVVLAAVGAAVAHHLGHSPVHGAAIGATLPIAARATALGAVGAGLATYGAGKGVHHIIKKGVEHFHKKVTIPYHKKQADHHEKMRDHHANHDEQDDDDHSYKAELHHDAYEKHTAAMKDHSKSSEAKAATAKVHAKNYKYDQDDHAKLMGRG